jgi:hypothetical protein
MVISNELFDHREELLARCLRDRGHSERVVHHIRAIDEAFRKQVVKSAPRPRRMAGIVLPLDGYGNLQMAVAGLCDGCGDCIEVGEDAVYHRRTGVTYCGRCASEKSLATIDSEA